MVRCGKFKKNQAFLLGLEFREPWGPLEGRINDQLIELGAQEALGQLGLKLRAERPRQHSAGLGLQSASRCTFELLLCIALARFQWETQAQELRLHSTLLLLLL